MRHFCSILMVLLTGAATADPGDSNIHYLVAGKSVAPWELSLQFGEVVLDGHTPGETLRGSLVASPANRNAEYDAVHFKWTPKGIKNEWGSEDINVMTVSLTNRMRGVNLTPVLGQAALTIDVRVLRAPNKQVTITLECAWDWRCRGEVPLKSVLRKIPEKEWISVPIPLSCFQRDDEQFNFGDITSILLSTLGKMELEISDVRLTAFPADQINCG